MINKNNTVPERYLKPGELFITDKPFLVKTVLGSCLTITMHSPNPRFSGICHAIFHNPMTKATCSGACAVCCRESFNGNSFKYVNCSITHMMREFNKYNIRPENTEIKVFGGASVAGNSSNLTGSLSVGEKNVQTALQYLSKAGLPIATSDTGGIAGRTLLFDTHSGSVYLKKIDLAMKRSG